MSFCGLWSGVALIAVKDKNYMLIEYLTQTLEGDKAFPSSSRVSAPPDLNDQEGKKIIRKTIIPEKFEKDIQALKEFIGESGFQPGATISVSLKELLEICPRNRRKVDTFKPLQKYLAEELGITHIIKSQKTK